MEAASSAPAPQRPQSQSLVGKALGEDIAGLDASTETVAISKDGRVNKVGIDHLMGPKTRAPTEALLQQQTENIQVLTRVSKLLIDPKAELPKDDLSKIAQKVYKQATKNIANPEEQKKLSEDLKTFLRDKMGVVRFGLERRIFMERLSHEKPVTIGQEMAKSIMQHPKVITSYGTDVYRHLDYTFVGDEHGVLPQPPLTPEQANDPKTLNDYGLNAFGNRVLFMATKMYGDREGNDRSGLIREVAKLWEACKAPYTNAPSSKGVAELNIDNASKNFFFTLISGASEENFSFLPAANQQMVQQLRLLPFEQRQRLGQLANVLAGISQKPYSEPSSALLNTPALREQKIFAGETSTDSTLRMISENKEIKFQFSEGKITLLSSCDITPKATQKLIPPDCKIRLTNELTSKVTSPEKWESNVTLVVTVNRESNPEQMKALLHGLQESGFKYKIVTNP